MVEVAKTTARATARREGAVRRTRRWRLGLGLGVWEGGESGMVA